MKTDHSERPARGAPAERRAYVRRAVRQACQTAVPGLGIVPCIITDYCTAGLFLRFSAPHRELGDVLAGEKVAITFRAEGADAKIKALGVIARITPVGLGLRLDSPPADLLRSLETTAKVQNQADLSVEYLTPGVPELVSELAARARCFTHTCMGDFVVRASMTLSSRALSVTDDDVMNALYAARSTLKEYENELVDGFPALIEEACLDLAASAPASSETAEEQTSGDHELVLTNDAEFGHWLSVCELAAKAEARYPVQLFDLYRRLNTIAEHPLEPASNPFSPLAVAQHFSDLIHSWPVSPEAFEVLYAGFAKAVVIPWENLVNELNELLIERDVQPSLSHGLEAWRGEVAEDGSALSLMPTQEPGIS